MLRSFYIFNTSGNMLYNRNLNITDENVDPRLVSAFLSAICSWAEMYSQTGLSLFQTGSIKFIFERSIYAKSLIFCICASIDHDDDDLKEKVKMIRENFVHFFWEDKKALEHGTISKTKLSDFEKIIDNVLISR
ncbi:MAG: hypothetical protein ACTSWN_06540 [Promethearchaeota archaeon]